MAKQTETSESPVCNFEYQHFDTTRKCGLPKDHPHHGHVMACGDAHHPPEWDCHRFTTTYEAANA